MGCCGIYGQRDLAKTQWSEEFQAEYLEAVGALLEDGMVLDGNRISWQESDENGRMLSCGVELAPRGGNPRYRRLEHRLITEEEAIDDADWLGGNGALPTWN